MQKLLIFVLLSLLLWAMLSTEVVFRNDLSNGETVISYKLFGINLHEYTLVQQSAYTDFCRRHKIESGLTGSYRSISLNVLGVRGVSHSEAKFARGEAVISQLLVSNLSHMDKVQMVNQYHMALKKESNFDLKYFYLKWAAKANINNGEHSDSQNTGFSFE